MGRQAEAARAALQENPQSVELEEQMHEFTCRRLFQAFVCQWHMPMATIGDLATKP